MENQILHCTIQNDVVKSPSFWINSSDCTNGTGQSHTISMTEYYFSLLMYPLIHVLKFLLRSMVTLAEIKLWIVFENDYPDSLNDQRAKGTRNAIAQACLIVFYRGVSHAKAWLAKGRKNINSRGRGERRQRNDVLSKLLCGESLNRGDERRDFTFLSVYFSLKLSWTRMKSSVDSWSIRQTVKRQKQD